MYAGAGKLVPGTSRLSLLTTAVPELAIVVEPGGVAQPATGLTGIGCQSTATP